MKDVIVVGGGASGMMAACVAAESGNNVVLLEKNEKLGKKIYITGKGRCNLTNNCEPNEFLTKVIHGQKFMMSAIYSFPPEKAMEFFSDNGLKIKVERGNRVFPESDHASDVTKTFEKALKKSGVKVMLSTPVIKIEKKDEKFFVTTNDETICADSVIVCTGGVSYPSTGSTGDGYVFAKTFSHTVNPLRPGLCGLNIKGDFYKELQGLSLKNVSLSCYKGEKKIYDEFGEMMFAHYGISGPIVISLSSILNELDLNDIILRLDLKPALSAEQLDKRILRDFDKYKNKKLSNALCELLPSRLIGIVIKKAGLSSDKAVNIITKEERERLLHCIKSFEMKTYGLRGFEEAIITSGGVSLKEINPKTMESKLCKGLYFCGEVLDVDAYTGGYNLQIAFATGYSAGKNV